MISKREANKIEKDERLLEAAYKLFVEKGIQNTTVSDIVKEANVAKGTFYLYYRDKKELEEKLVITEATKILYAAIHEASKHEEKDLDKVDLFLVAVDYIIDYIKENDSVLTFLKRNLAYALYALEDKENVHSYTKIFMSLKEVYAKKVDMPFVQDSEIVISLCVELLGSSIYSSLIYNSPRPIDEMKPHLHRVIRAIFNEYQITNNLPPKKQKEKEVEAWDDIDYLGDNPFPRWG